MKKNKLPFGMLWVNPDAMPKTTYQGKEFQTNTFSDGSELALYDFGARMYDPVLGRWHCADPMYQFDSPYNAMANNPVVNIDPDGMWSIPWGNIMSNIGGFLSSMTQTTSWVSLPFMTRNTITTQPNHGSGTVVSGAAMLLQAGLDGKKIQDAAGVMGRSMQSNSNALEQLYGNISSHVQKAWNNSFPTNKRGEVVSQEWGGIITKNTAGEYEMVDFHGSKSGSITFDYTKVPSTNEIIGDFHTHPYSPDEIEYFRKIIPNFDGLGETFSAGDFVNQGLLIKQKHIASGDQFIIMAGDVIYSAEIIDSKLAEVFFKNGNVQDALDNSQAYIDIHLDYGEASWNYLLEVQSNYEGNQPGISGVLFHRLKF
jgi:RHS repeat-associated protein